MNVRWLRILKPLRSLVIMMVIYHTNRVKQAAVREADGDDSLLLNEVLAVARSDTGGARGAVHRRGRRRRRR